MCILLLVAGFLVNAASSSVANETENLMALWAEHAYKWFMRQNCSEMTTVVEETCLMMKSTEKINYRIYGTEPIDGKKIGAVFPEGDTKHKVFHDGIVILDPFPVARFGHPILVFHINLYVQKSECDELKGFLIGELIRYFYLHA